ncbi:helix-turn-helix domain-containing protein [Antrihabitans sp. YC2-6]|uniref:TetR/AcrR family transcriptional regulator n=1 Tax=Antrihabitans sp. YC2-6 TaxID=2799498 RepID=UPI0027DDD2FC|nr:helix-turn-helix domain-containing protein [Antrihabitans sp. YC2-6]
MANPGPGRPRLEQRRRPGPTPRAEILDAAAELFTSRGYANTSTRRIADAVGIRQASLYHHFGTKDDILDALLAETIAEPIALAEWLLQNVGDPVAKLYALALFDTAQLCSSKWNLGALYLLPELRTERFESFRVRRDDLRAHYAELAKAVIAAGSEVDEGAQYLPFRLVETVINMRSDDGTSPEHAPRLIPGAALRVIGWTGDLHAVRAEAEGLLELRVSR